MRSWLVLAPSRPGLCDGIGDYTGHLIAALPQTGSPASLVVRYATPPTPAPADTESCRAVTTWTALDRLDGRGPASADAGVIVQYFPQAYARADFFALLRFLTRVRAAGRPVIVTAHELWVHRNGTWRRALIQRVHQAMLAALIRRADRVVVTNRLAADTLVGQKMVDAGRVTVIPVGPNIMPTGSADKARTPTLVLFGQPAALHAGALVVLGQWLDRAAGARRLIWLGRSPEDLRRHWSTLGLSDAYVTFDGGQPAHVVSAIMASAWIGLAPYVDGASTRRSSLSSLLAHGLPIVGLDGPVTDQTLRQSAALRLTPIAHQAQWVHHLDTLLADEPQRVRMSAAAHHLTTTALSWETIARQYVA